jgi:hypothetical protein
MKKHAGWPLPTAFMLYTAVNHLVNNTTSAMQIADWYRVYKNPTATREGTVKVQVGVVKSAEKG